MSDKKVRRLVLVATQVVTVSTNSDDRLPVGPRLDRLGELLAELVDPGAVGRAWIEVDGRDYIAGEEAVNLAGAATASASEGAAAPTQWSGLAAENVLCRVCLDPRRLAHWLGVETPPGRPIHNAVLELRLVTYQNGLYCHATLALFSHRPFSPKFGASLPVGPDDHEDDDEPIGVDDSARIVGWFLKAVRPGLTSWLAGPGLPPSKFRMFGRHVISPAFVVAVPTRGWQEAVHGVTRVLLDAAGPDTIGVAGSTFRRNISVLRRSVSTGNGDDDPRYLLVPRWGGRTDRDLQEQELESAELIRNFAMLETAAAASLSDLDTRFDTLTSHLRVYEEVGEQASNLWDALALHLWRRGEPLRWAHRSVELIHHTLLQGLADMDQIGAQIGDELARVNDTADDLRDRLDQLTVETPLSRLPIRDSITGAGYFERMRQLGRERTAGARRVTESYRILLDAMARAFDERRARETDAVARAALPIGVAVGLLGLVAVGEATLNLGVGLATWQERTIRGGSWVLAALATIGLIWIVVDVRRAARLGSREFDNHYQRLVAYLRDTSSVSLAEKSREREPNWAAVDEEHAATFAALWDDFFLRQWRERRRHRDALRTDLEEFAARTEEWCLRALLLAERPRSFEPYPLPRLVMLYRFCSQRLTGDTLAGLDLVSLTEFLAVLTQSCQLDETTARRLDTWWQGEQHESATEALKALEEMKVVPGRRPELPAAVAG